jgi:hypothetical protein
MSVNINDAKVTDQGAFTPEDPFHLRSISWVAHSARLLAKAQDSSSRCYLHRCQHRWAERCHSSCVDSESSLKQVLLVGGFPYVVPIPLERWR